MHLFATVELLLRHEAASRGRYTLLGKPGAPREDCRLAGGSLLNCSFSVVSLRNIPSRIKNTKFPRIALIPIEFLPNFDLNSSNCSVPRLSNLSTRRVFPCAGPRHARRGAALRRRGRAKRRRRRAPREVLLSLRTSSELLETTSIFQQQFGTVPFLANKCRSASGK